MEKSQKVSLVLLRLAAGWLFFYAGITKVLDPDWSAAGYLENAKTFPDFFAWFAQASILPITNFLNEWGLTLLGISLILGIFVRLTSIPGMILMLLYYLPVLEFPYIGKHSYIVDEHIIYALVLLLFAAINAGRIWGLENKVAKLPILRRIPKYKSWLG